MAIFEPTGQPLSRVEFCTLMTWAVARTLAEEAAEEEAYE
jgi:hypothetical protein